MKKIHLIICILLVFIIACSKQNEWLDAKKQKEMVIPETLKDFQAILDQFPYIHKALPIFGLVGTDDFFLSDIDYDRCEEDIRNGYIWNKNIWSADDAPNWTQGFQVIMYANVVLDGLKNSTRIPSNSVQAADIQGQAHFYRALFYHELAQLFCNAYSNNADNELGLPLRLTSDVNIIEQRSSLSKTYEQILADALKASQQLPEKSINNRRPSKVAALAILAKTYLVMGDFKNALMYAEEALKLKNTLLDFNSGYASLSRTYRFPTNPFDHPEVLFFATGVGYLSVMPATSAQATINEDLYNSYETTDLRKELFYAVNAAKQTKYRGCYTGANSNFAGLATNELYLISAECFAREGKNEIALQRINTLLQNRYKTGQYIPININNNENLLRFILQERRKELIGVGIIRWEDLKRLNTETRFQKTITRQLKGKTYSLEPNSPLYALPIPNNEVQFSGLTQNPR